MGSVPVVKRQEPVQRPLQCAGRGEVVPAERDAPVLMEDRALQPFHEAVGPRMARAAATCRPRRRRTVRSVSRSPTAARGSARPALSAITRRSSVTVSSGGAPPPGGPPFRMQPVGPVARQPSPPPIEHRAGHVVAPTRRAHVCHCAAPPAEPAAGTLVCCRRGSLGTAGRPGPRTASPAAFS